MRSDWKYVPLGEVADFFSGGTPKKSVDEYWQGGEIPWISAATLKDTMVSNSKTKITSQGLTQGSRLAKKDDILLLVRGSGLFNGIPMARVVSEVAFNQDIKAIRAKPGVNPKFLFASLLGLRSTFEEMLEFTGIGAGKLDLKKLKDVRVPVPSAAEQNWVAGLLEDIDEKIANNRALANDLDGMSRAIFKSWFVDFDPVLAKMDGQNPVGMVAETATLFPDELIDSELGLIPKGWQVFKLDAIAEMIRGRSYKSAELQESSTALVTLKSFKRGGGFRRDGFKGYVGSYKPEQRVEPGECIVACTDVTQNAEVVGRAALVEGSPCHIELVASLDVTIVRPAMPGVTSKFLFLLLSTQRWVDHAFAHSTGTTVLHLSKHALPTFKTVIPDPDLLDAFSTLCEPLIDRMFELESESAQLEELRDYLFPRLISGKIQLPEAEISTEENTA